MTASRMLISCWGTRLDRCDLGLGKGDDLNFHEADSFQERRRPTNFHRTVPTPPQGNGNCAWVVARQQCSKFPNKHRLSPQYAERHCVSSCLPLLASGVAQQIVA